MTLNNLKWLPAATLLAALSACGPGTQNDDSDHTKTVQADMVVSGASAPAPTGGTYPVGGLAPVGAINAPTAAVVASHFLAQASFGPNQASINEVVSLGPAGWLNAQFAKPQTSHRAYLQQLAPTLAASDPLGADELDQSFWRLAIKGSDQLRQRMTFALSQIMVVSVVDDRIAHRPLAFASYYDTLGRNAFGNFRDLLQAVTLEPAMGVYLSHMCNQKEDGIRTPDENFAREIMQLMTIGLYELNQDGTQKLINGKPIETYSHADVAGLAKVFTGWGWGGPDKSKGRFLNWVADPARDYLPMQSYPDFHSTSEKRFLGKVITGATSPEADLKVALDTLFNHPNVGPFIGRQLIQRLVSSNPSPAYVSRVAAAFANNGSGVRGDMKAVIRAILLDPEAAIGGGSEKVREPVIRVANWMRAFDVTSLSGQFPMDPLDDPVLGLGQTPFRSPTVFNFYRPTYAPPNSALAAAGKVGPELQITGEPTVIGYLNYVQGMIIYGTGVGREIQPNYNPEIALADRPALLLDRVNLLLTNGTMPPTLYNLILSALNGVAVPVATATNAAQVLTAKTYRVRLAIFLTMASPAYLVQQ